MKSTQFQIGDLILDINHHHISRNGKTIELPGLSYKVLEVLAFEWPATVGRQELVKAVWGKVIVSDDTLRQRIRLLRQVLGDSDYIKTIKGLGYRLSLPVESINIKNWYLNRYLFIGVLLIGLAVLAFWQSTQEFDLKHEIKHTIRHAGSPHH